jgi:hypothetical protein
MAGCLKIRDGDGLAPKGGPLLGQPFKRESTGARVRGDRVIRLAWIPPCVNALYGRLAWLRSDGHACFLLSGTLDHPTDSAYNTVSLMVG